MAKIVPGTEVGLEGQGRVRVSTSRARRGKILAVEHPIFGWLPYRQWALLRLVPEERILPAIIIGVSTFTVAKLAMDAADVVVDFVTPPFTPEAQTFFSFLPLGSLFTLVGGLVFPGAPDPMEMLEPDLLKDNPLPFYVATMAAGLTLAGLDPGMALRAFAEILNALIPL